MDTLLIFLLDVEDKIKNRFFNLEWWISGLMLDPLFFLILRLNNDCSPLVINLQIYYLIVNKDIPFKSFQLS